MAQKEKSPSGKKGTCSNCGREKYIADKNGHCGTCHTAVEGMDPGSTAYTAALAAIKGRINAPGFKTRPAKQKKAGRKPASNVYSAPKLNNMKSTLDMTIKEVADAGLCKILRLMRDEYENHLVATNKLSDAIKLLESL